MNAPTHSGMPLRMKGRAGCPSPPSGAAGTPRPTGSRGERNRIVTTITLALGVVSFFCLVGFLLALHDIFQDYVSPKVLRDYAAFGVGIVPGWSRCPMEWTVVDFGFLPMLVFHLVFFVSLVRQARWWGGRTSNAKAVDPILK
mgnify:CR=1 FL=1